MILLYLDLGTNGCDGNQNAKKDYNSTEAIALTLSKDKGKDAEENQRCRDQKIDQLWIPVPDLLTCTGICLVAVFFSISIHFFIFLLNITYYFIDTFLLYHYYNIYSEYLIKSDLEFKGNYIVFCYFLMRILFLFFFPLLLKFFFIYFKLFACSLYK